jgi:hypothetical protein
VFATISSLTADPPSTAGTNALIKTMIIHQIKSKRQVCEEFIFATQNATALRGANNGCVLDFFAQVGLNVYGTEIIPVRDTTS